MINTLLLATCLTGDAGRPAAQEGLIGAEILADLLDRGNAALAADLRGALVSRGLDALLLLERVASRVRSEGGKAEVERMFTELRSRVRKEDPTSLAAAARKLPAASLWKLGIVLDERGTPTLFFEARPYADAARLEILEYLVCPDPPGDKSYEAWGSMRPEDYAEFSRALEKADGPLRLRWRDEGGRTRVEPLDRLLPWATALERRRGGLCLGPNHDESRHPVLAKDLADPWIGVPLKIPK